MPNLAKRNCMGPFVYNNRQLQYIKKHGKPITDIPTERDSNNKNVSPLIALAHIPSGKVNAYKNWFYFSEDEKHISRIHTNSSTEAGELKPTNNDFMYVLISDDINETPSLPSPNPFHHEQQTIESLIEQGLFKIYDQKLFKGLGTFKNFNSQEINNEFLLCRENKEKKFDSSFTEKELKSNWYKKFKLHQN